MTTDTTIEFAPGPNLTFPLAEPPAPIKEMSLQDRLRKYSPTSGYARYTAMAANRIDELTAMGAAQQAQISRLKRILEERNYTVHALTVENEHHKVNETKLQELIIKQRQAIMEFGTGHKATVARAEAAEAKLNAAMERGLFATIIHYFRNK